MNKSDLEFLSRMESAMVCCRIAMENLGDKAMQVSIAANGPTIGTVIERALAQIEKEKVNAKAQSVVSIRQTHTYAILEISKPAYDEVRALLKDAGYEHAFIEGDRGELLPT